MNECYSRDKTWKVMEKGNTVTKTCLEQQHRRFFFSKEGMKWFGPSEMTSAFTQHLKYGWHWMVLLKDHKAASVTIAWQQHCALQALWFEH